MSGCIQSAEAGDINSNRRPSSDDLITAESSLAVESSFDSSSFSLINASSTNESKASLVDSNPLSSPTPTIANTTSQPFASPTPTPTRMSLTPTNAPTYPNLTTREKLNDVGSHVWNGYYYFFENVNSDIKAIYKKKINSNEGVIKVLSVSCSSFEVLNNYIYYNDNNGRIFKMDLDGGNVKQLYDQCYFIHQVAGNWIFADHDGQLYMLRIDGTQVKLLSPDTAYDYAHYTNVYGFDHGFCYYFTQNQWYSKKQNVPNTIMVECASNRKRVDYRSDDPFIESYGKYIGDDQLNVLRIVYGKAFLMGSNTSCKYVDLVNAQQKEICSGIKNSVSFLDDYVFFTHEEKTKDASGQVYSLENFRFVNIINGNITDFPCDFSWMYTIAYEDINNNNIYLYCTNNSKHTTEIVRYTPDGTTEVLYKLDRWGNFIP